MSKVKVAAVQMRCAPTVEENLQHAEALVREAAANGAQIVLLPELWERPYFCQQRRYDFYQYALPTEENPAVQMGKRLAKELNIVLPISFFERDVNELYNCIACNTKYGRVGIGICWDQWFPETARCLALNGAELLFYPTAIGSEPILDCDSMPHWRRVMQGHSAANLMPVVAANRMGLETVEPCEGNAGQQSSLLFYGSSFMTDGTGALVQDASRDQEEILYAEYDLAALSEDRLSWGLFRDRRPECYGKIAGK